MKMYEEHEMCGEVEKKATTQKDIDDKFRELFNTLNCYKYVIKLFIVINLDNMEDMVWHLISLLIN